MVKLFIFSFFVLFNTIIAQAGSYNPWYFEIDCHTYKVAEENDVVTAYRYNKSTQNFEFFQRLSDYAQKIDYSMEGVGRHFVGVTDESGHLVVYKWHYGNETTPAKFVYWG